MTMKIKFTNNLVVIEFTNNLERDTIIDMFYLQRKVDIENINTFTDKDDILFNYSRYPNFKGKVKKVVSDG